ESTDIVIENLMVGCQGGRPAGDFGFPGGTGAQVESGQRGTIAGEEVDHCVVTNAHVQGEPRRQLPIILQVISLNQVAIDAVVGCLLMVLQVHVRTYLRDRFILYEIQEVAIGERWASEGSLL